jgi:hypothetical protein
MKNDNLKKDALRPKTLLMFSILSRTFTSFTLVALHAV